MKLFLDSAKVDEIRYALDMWDISGITSNPRHIEASGKPFLKAIAEIGELIKGSDVTLSVEVNPHFDQWEDMVKQARYLSSLHPNFVIKLPATEPGFKATKVLQKEGVRCNVTLIFSAMQAMQAMRMGAHFISPFIGWKESNAEEIRGFIQEISIIRDTFEYSSEIIVAAVRNARQMVESATVGADIVTAGFQVYKAAFEHPYTNMGLQKFIGFWDKTLFE